MNVIGLKPLDYARNCQLTDPEPNSLWFAVKPDHAVLCPEAERGATRSACSLNQLIGSLTEVQWELAQIHSTLHRLCDKFEVRPGR
jgi:hypothetical protein